MYPIYADSTDEESEDHTVVEAKPHWSTLKRKFIAAFSAITVIGPSKEDHRAAKTRAEELLTPRDSEPELTNARWTAKLDMARNQVAQVEYDVEMSMFRHWKLAVREQEMQEESEPLPSVSIAAPYVVREQRPFYSFAEEQAAHALATLQVRRVAQPFMLSRGKIAALGAVAGALIAIACVAATGGSPAAMASSRPTMFPMFEQAKPVAAPVTMRTITTQPIEVANDATRLPPVEHRFDAPIAATVPTVAPIIETAPALDEAAEEAPIVRAPTKRSKRHISKRKASAEVSKVSKASKRRPITVNTSTALGDLRPSRR